MSDFGATPTSNASINGTTTDIPGSAMYVPGTPGATLTMAEGINASTDGNGKKSAASRVGLKDGDDATQGLTTDAAVTGDNPGTNAAKLRGLAKIFADVWDSVNHRLHVNVDNTVAVSGAVTTSGTVTEANSAAILAALDDGQETMANSLSVVIASDQSTVPTLDTNSAAIKADLDSLVTNTADLLADGDHLATIDTNTANIPAKGTALMAGSTPVTIATNDTVFTEMLGDTDNLAGIKSDLDSLVTNTADLLADGDNLSTIATNTTGLATHTDATGIKSDLDEIALDTDNLATILTALQGVLFIKRNAVAVYSLASVQTSGATQNSGDLTVGPYTELGIDINTTAQSGTSPTIQYFFERKGADGLYYPLWQSAVLTLAANTLTTSIGAGLAYTQMLGLTARLRWVVGGSATPTYTHSINIYGK